MKPLYRNKTLQFFILIFISGISEGFAQTVGVNTDGSVPSTLFHTKNTIAGEDNNLRIENTIGNRETGINLLNSTTANANWKFYIPASSDALRLYNGSDFVTFLQNGNVGIGRTDPASRLDLGSATSSNKPLFRLHPGDATIVNYSGFWHHDLLMGSYIPGSGFAHHYISFGYGGGGSGDGDGNPANGRKLHIGSANTADFSVASFVPQFTFTSSGMMGIGISGPLTKLHTEGTQISSFTGNTRGIFTLSAPYNAGYYTSIDFLYTTNSSPTARIAAYHDGGGSKLILGTSNDYSTGITNTGLTIDNLGYVGIGITAPAHTLDMGGRGRNLRFGTYFHMGEGVSGASSIICNNCYVNPSLQDRADYNGGVDGVNAIEMSYLRGISFFAQPISAGNTTGDLFFSGSVRTYERMRIGTDGNVGIGTYGWGYKLTVNGQPAANGYTAFTNYSDARLKKNIRNIENCLDKIMQLRPVEFSYNEEYLSLYEDTSALIRIQKGFIAQEVMELFPEMVGTMSYKDKEYHDLNLSHLQVYLVKAMQEQQETIEILRNTINAQQDRISVHENIIKLYEDKMRAQEGKIDEILTIIRFHDLKSQVID